MGGLLARELSSATCRQAQCMFMMFSEVIYYLEHCMQCCTVVNALFLCSASAMNVSNGLRRVER